jgi:hypothetical protein
MRASIRVTRNFEVFSAADVLTELEDNPKHCVIIFMDEHFFSYFTPYDSTLSLN